MVGIKKLEKGDVLLKEGEQSASMFWLQTGSLRLFKKKGNGFIELGVLHSGELVGEMSFLDNQPRSASVEALTPCDLIEIPRGKFDEVMKTLPSWLNSLVQTLVKRMRVTNNRLREIESASTVYTTNELGQTTKQHEFISTNELLRLCTALLFCSIRKGEAQADRSIKLNAAVLHMYGGNIMQIPVAKVAAFMDILGEAGVMAIDRQKDKTELTIYSSDFLDRFVTFVYEDNLKTDDKRLPLTDRGIILCDMIYQFGDLKSFGNQETATLNIEAILKKASETLQTKIPLDPKIFHELVRAGLASELKAVSADNNSSDLNLARFRSLYPCVNLRQRFRDLNEAKRNPGTGG